MMDIVDIGRNAKEASRALALADAAVRRRALNAIADALTANEAALIKANELDVSAAREGGMTEAFIDRLTLTHARISAMAEGAREVASLPDPLGRVLSELVHANGMHIAKTSVPLGVIGVIFESRPNVAVDSAALCLMSGNACILRGGREAIRSNAAEVQLIREAIAKSDIGLPEDCVQLVMDTTHEGAERMMRLNGYIDVLIPRGGRNLIRSVVEKASVPVIETGAGVCHTYVDKYADIPMAADIVYNAKVSRPSVCNALECLLVHRDIAKAALPVIASRLKAAGVSIHGDAATCELLPAYGVIPATEADWGCEYGSLTLACRVVEDMDAAIAHIRRYGTGHSECIITGDDASASRFIASIDAAAVYHNASTRFTDGGEFGLGAEIGISTQKLHARGPLGLNELTTMKYIVRGSGQTR